jgi:hypothetical protein
VNLLRPSLEKLDFSLVEEALNNQIAFLLVGMNLLLLQWIVIVVHLESSIPQCLKRNNPLSTPREPSTK